MQASVMMKILILTCKILDLTLLENIDIKIMNLPGILENLQGKAGVLRMEDYDENTKRVSLEPKKEQ